MYQYYVADEGNLIITPTPSVLTFCHHYHHHHRVILLPVLHRASMKSF